MLLTVIHDSARLVSYAYVACFFLEFTHSTLLDCLVRIDEAGWHLDDHLVDRGSVLLLKEELRAAGLVQDGHNSDAIDLTICGPSLFCC